MAARSFIRPQLPLLRRYPGNDEDSPPQGASSNFVDCLARREIKSRAYSARRSAWKLGGFPLIAWSRYGEQICAPLHRLSTAIHQILWLSFRAIARCGPLCKLVEMRSARLVAALEIVLCSDFLTQFAIGETLRGFGLSPTAANGDLSVRFVVGLL